MRKVVKVSLFVSHFSGDLKAVIIVIRQYCDFIRISAVPVELGAARDRGIAHICRQSGQIFARRRLD